MTRITHTITSTDGRIVHGETQPTSYEDEYIATLLGNGIANTDETTLLRLPPDTVRDIADEIFELSDEDLSRIVEIWRRIEAETDLVRELDRIDVRNAWKHAHDEAIQMWKQRHGRLDHPHPLPSYESAEGVPKAAGAAATRVLSGWVVELTVVDSTTEAIGAETIVAEAVERISITANAFTVPEELTDEPAWKLVGLNSAHADEILAMAPLEASPYLTVWRWDETAEEWTDHCDVTQVRTWPDEKTWEMVE